MEIVSLGGLDPIVDGAVEAASFLNNNMPRTNETNLRAIGGSVDNYEELAAQCCRALRNLSVNPENRDEIRKKNAIQQLEALLSVKNERISQQARRALRNLGISEEKIAYVHRK